MNPSLRWPKKTATVQRFQRRDLAYVLEREDFTNPGIFISNAIGATCRKTIHTLKTYDMVTSRNAGTIFKPCPDSVVTIKHFFDDLIQKHRDPSLSKSTYVAFQMRKMRKTNKYDIDFIQYRVIASQLESLSLQTGMPIVMFLASAAPGHDSFKDYRQIQAHFRNPERVRIANDINIWSICATIANARINQLADAHRCFCLPSATSDAGCCEQTPELHVHVRQSRLSSDVERLFTHRDQGSRTGRKSHRREGPRE